MPDLPQYDDLIKLALLGLFGPGLMVTLFVVLNFVVSWYGVAKKAVEYGRRTGDLTRQISNACGDSSAQPILATLLTLLLQIAWLITGFLFANLLALFFGRRPNVPDFGMVPTGEVLEEFLKLDVVSWSYLIIAALGLGMSYRYAVKYKDPQGIEAFFSIPAYVLAVGGVSGAALLWFMGEAVALIWASLVLGVFSLLYGIASGLIVFKASSRLIECWRPQLRR